MIFISRLHDVSPLRYHNRRKRKYRFFFFVVLIIFNFFRTSKAMCKVEKVIEICSQLGSIQEFCKFVDRFHQITKCTEPNCPVRNLGSELKKEMLDENLS